MTAWLRDLREKAGRATPGPHRVVPAITGSPPFVRAQDDRLLCSQFRNDADAEFVAACSPERVVALCDVAEAAQTYLAAEDEWRLRHGMGRDRVPFRKVMESARHELVARLAALELPPARRGRADRVMNTAYGFRWGPLMVERAARIEGRGYAVTVRTVAGRAVELFVTEAGQRIHVSAGG